MAVARIPGADGVATVTLDDGKVNAFDLEFFEEFEAVLDRCREDAAVVLTGREGVFSAGLDTKLIARSSVPDLRVLLERFGRVMLRVWTEPRPTVAAVTGHALAGGTILAMACDHTIAAAGDYAWGLTETTIGFPLPQWVIAIARHNLRADRLEDLLLPGVKVGPAEAVEAGFADAVVPADRVRHAATERAQQLAQLPLATYAETKRRLRCESERLLAGLAGDTRAVIEHAARGGTTGRWLN